MERPARKCCEFADTSGEFVSYYCRAVGDRPYIVIVKCAFFDTLRHEHGVMPFAYTYFRKNSAASSLHCTASGRGMFTWNTWHTFLSPSWP